MLLWLQCCTQIDFVYLFIFDCFWKYRERDFGQPPQLLWLGSFVDSKVANTSSAQLKRYRDGILVRFSTNLSDWITFCCIHQHFVVFIYKFQCFFHLSACNDVRPMYTLRKPCHRIVCSFLVVLLWFQE